MRANKVRELFKEGKPVIAGFLSIDSSYSAELMGTCGYDTVVVDLQHAPIYLDKAVPMLQALSAAGVVPMARCSSNQLFEINKLLDGGSYGIVCPMVDTVPEAEDFVAACRYPPLGRRSYGPTRGLLYGGRDYFDHADATILTFAMIETRQALENLDGICAVAGLDGLLVGPSDLSIALGQKPTGDWSSGPLRDALGTILSACKRAGRMAGIVCVAPAFATAMKEAGWDLIVVGTDTALLRQAAESAVAAVRAA